jgi:8-oxo-dGTP pyrophosphatase MutT (NUDIX family)
LPVSQFTFTADEFRERVAHRFEMRAQQLAETAGDHALNPDYAEHVKTREFKDAAILFALVEGEPHPTVLLTQRSDKLNNHSGQIAFPGGRIDEGETPIEAALREADEEVGLPASSVEVLGAMGPYFSGSGYKIHPVVGVVRDLPELTINEAEVADVFHVPLAFLMDQASHEIESRFFKGNERFFYAMPYRDTAVAPAVERRIWGVTAGIIRVIQERLYGE